jgi:hypothetical protein
MAVEGGFSVAHARDRLSLFGERRLIVASRAPLSDAPFSLLLDGQVIREGRLHSEGKRWGFEHSSFDLDSPLGPGSYRLTVRGRGNVDFTLADEPLDIVRILGSFWAFHRASEEKCRVEGEFDYQGNHHVPDIGLPAFRASNWGQNKERLDRRSGDMSGGWHDATSTDKDTFDEAGAAAMLGIACQFMEEGPATEATVAEMTWGLDYLLKIQNPSGSFPFGVNPFMPWDGTGLPRHLVVNELPGVAANAARALAIGSTLLAVRDPGKSEACLSAARRAFAWAVGHQGEFGFFDLPCMWTGGAVSLLDAASELYRATGDADYARYVEEMVAAARFKDLVFSHGESDPGVPAGPNGAGGPKGFPGQFDRAMNYFETCMLQPAVALCRYREVSDAPTRARIDRLLGEFVDQVAAQSRNPYGIFERGLTPDFGPNIYLACIAHQLAFIAVATGDQRAARMARDNYAWGLGRNPWGSSFYYGIGGKCVIEPYGRNPEESYGALLPGPLLQKDGSLSFEHPQYNEWRIREAGIGLGNSAHFSLERALIRLRG